MTQRQNGFTLVEVLVATAIFAAVLSALPPMLIASAHASLQTRETTAATILAATKVEELRALPTLVSGSYSDPESLDEDGGTTGSGTQYLRSWVVSDGPAAGTHEVSVRVAWSHRGEQAVDLDTVIAR
ncbi:MAG: type II secretion system protein [Candidatus Binatia bacterium]